MAAEAPQHIEALYLHVPFCVRRCAYCGFYSQAITRGAAGMGEYVEALTGLVRRAAGAGLLQGVKTAYIGGGTPTFVGESLLPLVRAVRANCPGLEEFTCEANPDSLSAKLAHGLRDEGATRISLGVQSLDDAELRALGRAHDSAQALAAARLVKSLGLDLSCDLMCGIPGQSLRTWETSLAGVVGAGADHVSCYPLSIEEGTPFDDAVLAGRMQLPDSDLQADMMLHAADFLAQQEFSRYEVASYARRGHACRHNIAYWTGKPYLGLGAAASSMLTPQLYAELTSCMSLHASDEETGECLVASSETLERQPARVRLTFDGDWKSFAYTALSDESLSAHGETLTSRQAAAEDLMLAMRMVAPLTPGQLEALVERGIPRQTLCGAIDCALAEGLVFRDAGGGIAPTQRGWLLGNELFGLMWDTASA